MKIFIAPVKRGSWSWAEYINEHRAKSCPITIMNCITMAMTRRVQLTLSYKKGLVW